MCACLNINISGDNSLDACSDNGTHVQTAGTATSLKAEFTAQDLFNYVTDDTGRLSDVVIYIPACTIG